MVPRSRQKGWRRVASPPDASPGVLASGWRCAASSSISAGAGAPDVGRPPSPVRKPCVARRTCRGRHRRRAAVEDPRQVRRRRDTAEGDGYASTDEQQQRPSVAVRKCRDTGAVVVGARAGGATLARPARRPGRGCEPQPTPEPKPPARQGAARSGRQGPKGRSRTRGLMPASTARRCAGGATATTTASSSCTRRPATTRATS